MLFTFPPNTRDLASAAHVLVVAKKSTFGPRARGFLPIRALLPHAADLVHELGAEANPGLLGGLATARLGARRITVAALPDAVSRHDGPARAEAIRRVAAGAGLSPAAANAVLLVLDSADHLLPALNALGRALPTFSRKTGARRDGSLAIHAALPDGTVLPVPAATRDLVETARAMAELVDTPPTELDPATFAAAARAFVRGRRGVRVRELAGPALLRAGLQGIHAVGRAARSAPRLLVLSTAGRKAGHHVALVGKGVTYDTGGLHLKARGSMETMKHDMAGAAAVLGAFAWLARHGAPCRVTALLCLAENAIGPLAFKPDDVLTLHSGKTVEINNTDAEGRLLLADGCSYAARVLGADVVLDAATLTGAQAIATGELHAAVVANDEAVEKVLLDAGRATGDLCWPLPFAPAFYRGEFASPVADMRNSVKNRNNAQASCAAEFVHWHLDGTAARWGHVDLAAPAFRGDRATGFGVALLAEAVARLGRA